MAYGDGQNRITRLTSIAGAMLIVGLIGIGIHDAGQVTPSSLKGPQWITAKGSAKSGITAIDYKSTKASGVTVVDRYDPGNSETGSSLPISWPGNHTVYWGKNYQTFNGASKGLWILDATKNDHRKVFRIRPAGRRTAGNLSAQTSNMNDPAATLFLSPGGIINIYLPPGLYEVYAASGE